MYFHQIAFLERAHAAAPERATRGAMRFGSLIREPSLRGPVFALGQPEVSCVSSALETLGLQVPPFRAEQ